MWGKAQLLLRFRNGSLGDASDLGGGSSKFSVRQSPARPTGRLDSECPGAVTLPAEQQAVEQKLPSGWRVGGGGGLWCGQGAVVDVGEQLPGSCGAPPRRGGVARMPLVPYAGGSAAHEAAGKLCVSTLCGVELEERCVQGREGGGAQQTQVCEHV